MKKTVLLPILVVVVQLATGAIAEAQQPARIPRIGILATSSASFYSARVEAFRQRLRELGYVEGKNIFIEYRYAEGKLERLPDLAAELVRLKVDVIVTGGGPTIAAAKKASPTMRIVFAGAADPVGTGLVSSLARPGGPRGNEPLTGLNAAAKALKLKLQSLPVRGLDDFASAFARLKREGAQALITTPTALINTQQRQVLDFAAKNRLPAMYPQSEFVEAGGLMSYAPNYTDLFRRAADFVDKILKGTKPSRYSRRAADEVRVHRQSESSQSRSA